jgi:pimeloyl-ACP methyl ester carboxylesterase
MRTLRSELAAGREVHLVTFSMGSMIALNVLNELEASIPRRDRARRMGLIKWVSLGGAIFGPGHFASDGYPSHLGGMVRLDDVRDGVSHRWGGLDFAMASDFRRHLIYNYAPALTKSLFDGRWGQLVLDGPNRILLDEIVKGGPNPPRILVRVFPVPGQKSRGTVNFDVPKAWGEVEVTIVEGNRGQRFTWMDDCSGWFDSSVSKPLTSGSKTRVSSDGDYLGRISWDPSVEDKSKVVKREFMVEFRPAKS